MSAIGDERIAFYLENRKHIDEWLQLRTEASQAVHAVFRQLDEPLEGVASELDGAPLLIAFLEGAWPAYALLSRGWLTSDDGQRPLIGITLEMDRSNLFDGPVIPNTFVGVRVEKSFPRGPELHQAVLATRGHPSYANKPTPWWPCWRYISQSREHWWEDRQSFEQTLISGLAQAWQDLASVVTDGLASLAPIQGSETTAHPDLGS